MNEKPPTSEFGIWLRDQRKKKGLSQRDIAESIGIGYRSVSAWEQRARYRPSKKFLPALAELLDVSLDEIKEIAGYGSVVVHQCVIKTRLKGGCECCLGHIQCKRAVIVGLPILCETVTRADIMTIHERGLEDEFRSIRRL